MIPNKWGYKPIPTDDFTRYICSKCGACRCPACRDTDYRCVNCGSTEVTVQKRTAISAPWEDEVTPEYDTQADKEQDND